jgi:hypothetical protein
MPHSAVAEKDAPNNSSWTEYVVFWAVVISGTAVTVIYAPVVIPVAIANVKAAAIIAGTKAAAAGTAIKAGSVVIYTKTVAAGTAIKTGCAAAAPIVKVLSPVVAAADCAIKIAEQAPEIGLNMARTLESHEFFQAQKDFEKCMSKYADQKAFIVPEACKKEELLFALLVEANIQRK